MLETIAVICVVAVAVFLVGRALHRTLAGKDAGCGCTGSCATCRAGKQSGCAPGDDR
jgi:hypothetical protein